jgi:hypothetical protein
MPNNFLHVGLIHLILPNAKIIDAGGIRWLLLLGLQAAFRARPAFHLRASRRSAATTATTST